MIPTFTQFVANPPQSLIYYTTIPETVSNLLNVFVPAWVEAIEEAFTGQVPHPLRGEYLRVFKRDVDRELEQMERLGPPTLTLGVKSRLDRHTNTLLAREDMMMRTTPARPALTHDSDFTYLGVCCVGAIIGSDGGYVGNFHNQSGYSGNFGGSHARKLVGGGSGSPLRLIKAIPNENWQMMSSAKPGTNQLGLMGDGHHAEDEWFAYNYHAFVTQVLTLSSDIADLPFLSTRLPWQQITSAPRIEFLMTLPPCAPSQNTQEGCQAYFAALRGAVGAKIPIVIYGYRVWESDQDKKQTYLIDGTGAFRSVGLSWSH